MGCTFDMAARLTVKGAFIRLVTRTHNCHIDGLRLVGGKELARHGDDTSIFRQQAFVRLMFLSGFEGFCAPQTRIDYRSHHIERSAKRVLGLEKNNFLIRDIDGPIELISL